MTVTKGGDATGELANFGIGLSFGLNLIQNGELAEIASTITGSRSVSIKANSDITSLTKARAGGSVGVAPSLALLVSGTTTKARLSVGADLALTQGHAATARQSHRATADASTVGVTLGAGPVSCNAQAKRLTGFADGLTGQSTVGTAEAQAVGGQSVGVAAGLSVNIVAARSEMILTAGLMLITASAVTFMSALDVEAGATALGPMSACRAPLRSTFR